MSSVLLTEAPAGWRRLRFDRVVHRSKESGKPNFDPLSVYLEDGVVPRSSRDDNHNRLGADMSNYLVVRPGDIVFNKLRTWQGGLGVSRHLGVVSPAYFVCRPVEDTDSRYYHYLLRSNLYLAELTRLSKFMPPSQFDIAWDDLRTMSVLLPPLRTQQAIADYLDTETARIDALITKKRRMIDLLGEQVDAQVFAAVSGSLSAGSAPRKHTQIPWLDTIPSHWGSPWLGANHSTQLGKMLSASAAAGPEQHLYVKNTNVQWDRFNLTDLPTMTFDASDRARCSLEHGDLLVCEGGEVGRAAVWPGTPADVFFQKAIHRVRSIRTEAEPRYTMYCLWAAANMNVFAVEGNQATIVHLTGEKLREHRFPWPPLAEQREIVRRLDESRVEIEAMVQRLSQQIELLTERRQALITAAVTGELEIPGVAT